LDNETVVDSFIGLFSEQQQVAVVSDFGVSEI
jgi:hypothetical protein